MDDIARGFHEELMKDFRDIMANKDNPELVLIKVSGIVATVITDINRIARALERQADAAEKTLAVYENSQ